MLIRFEGCAPIVSCPPAAFNARPLPKSGGPTTMKGAQGVIRRVTVLLRPHSYLLVATRIQILIRSRVSVIGTVTYMKPLSFADLVGRPGE